jgi:mannan endo-1,4-beta-mannosidase
MTPGRSSRGAGSEGFFADRPGGEDWTRNGVDGVDTVRLAALPSIDVMSYHLYPDGWGKTPAWGTQWILDHAAAARRLHKPVMLGEFGLKDKATRNPWYQKWTDAVLASGTTGALYWILSDRLDDGSLYGDFDGFTVYCPSPVCTTIGDFSQRMRGRRFTFPPVADDDTATVEFGLPLRCPHFRMTCSGCPRRLLPGGRSISVRRFRSARAHLRWPMEP